MIKIEKNYGIICDVGGKGKGNQDSCLINVFDLVVAPGAQDSKEFSYKCILAIVCDGVSASSHGEKGSTFVVRNLSAKIMTNLIIDNFNPERMEKTLNNIIHETNTELLAEYKQYVEMGKVPKTTLVGLLIIGQYLWMFNLGDSPAFLIKDELIGKISKDHIGTGATHEITEAMGQQIINPHIQFFNWAYENDHRALKLAFSNEYYALICSDGLTDKVNPEEIKQILKDNSLSSMQQKVKKLYDLTMERGIDDNVSIVAIDLAKYISDLSNVQILKLSYP